MPDKFYQTAFNFETFKWEVIENPRPADDGSQSSNTEPYRCGKYWCVTEHRTELAANLMLYLIGKAPKFPARRFLAKQILIKQCAADLNNQDEFWRHCAERDVLVEEWMATLLAHIKDIPW